MLTQAKMRQMSSEPRLPHPIVVPLGSMCMCIIMMHSASGSRKLFITRESDTLFYLTVLLFYHLEVPVCNQ